MQNKVTGIANATILSDNVRQGAGKAGDDDENLLLQAISRQTQ